MTQTNNLKIDLVAQSQAQKEVTINEAIYILEALQNKGVKDKDLATPPVSPTAGDSYIVAASPTGAWAGKAGCIAYYNQTWKFIMPNEGLILWVNDEDKIYAYDGTNWVSYADNLNNLSKLGINTAADATNKLAVSSAAVLFNHNGTNSQVKVNKNAAANTASHLFQTGFSGRAEFGLIGDDNFTVKVSPDGTTFYTGVTVNKSNGQVYLPSGASFDNGTNILSAYEIGTFTPTLYGSTTAGTPTYSAQAGGYTRIGDLIYCSGRVVVTGGLGGATGEIRIGGLPYVNKNDARYRAGVTLAYYAGLNLATGANIGGYVHTNGVYVRLIEFTNTTGTSFLTDAKFGAGTIEIYFNVTYMKN